MSIESAVKALTDRVQILETMYAYCRHADNLDAAAMVALFVDECVANYVPGGPETVLRGKAALTQMLAQALANTISGSHHISNAELRFDTPDTCSMHCYMYSWQRFTGYPMTADCHRWGRYENQFVRTPGGWRLKHLHLMSAGEYGGARIGEQLHRAFPPNFEDK